MYTFLTSEPNVVVIPLPRARSSFCPFMSSEAFRAAAYTLALEKNARLSYKGAKCCASPPLRSLPGFTHCNILNDRFPHHFDFSLHWRWTKSKDDQVQPVVCP